MREIAKIPAVGQKFGSWTMLRLSPYGRAVCRCVCGIEREVSRRHLHAGSSKSCGCRMWERNKDANTVQRVDQILCFVANESGLQRDAMRGKGRWRPLAQIRQLAMWLAREHSDASLPAIARVFGKIDHTTILHGIRETEKRIASDREWRNLSRSLAEKMQRQSWFAAEKRAA